MSVNTLPNSQRQVGHPDGECVLVAGRLPVASATNVTQIVMRFAYVSGVEACSEVTYSGCVMYTTLCVSELDVDRRKTSFLQAQESIKQFIVQLMHINSKILRLLK